MIKRRLLFYMLMVAATAVLVTLIFTDWLPILRGPAPDGGEWHWGYRPRPVGRWWAALSSGLLIFIITWGWLRQRTGKRWVTVTAVAALAIASFLLQLSFVYADRANLAAELVDRTLAVQTNGYFWTAAHIDDLNAVLRDYPAAMSAFESDHARTHPPGLVIANWLTIAALERRPQLSGVIAQAVRPLRCTDLWLLNQPDHIIATLGVWAILPLVLAAAAVFPTYALARHLSGAKAAVLATAMMAALPALLIFAPLPDQIYTLITLLIILALHRGLSQRRGGWFFCAGLLLSLSSFLTLGNVTLLIVIAIYAAVFIWQTTALKHNQTLGLRWLLAFGLGAVAIWLVYWLGWDVPPWEIGQAGLAEHYTLVTSQRRYDWWLGYNLVDLVVFAGLPAVVGLVGGAILAMRNVVGRRSRSATTLAISVTALILLLNVSGSTRGEVGRIWLFLMPLVVIAGAIFLAEWQPDRRSVQLFLGLQLAMALSVGLSWGVVEATIGAAERPSLPPPPANVTPLNISFGEPITLDAYALSVTANQLDLTLQWRASGPASRPYTVFTHLTAENGLVAQQDNWPAQGQWPPTCWQSGERITDNYSLALPPDLPPGDYRLYAGLYDAATGTRLLTDDGRDAVLLQYVQYPGQSRR